MARKIADAYARRSLAIMAVIAVCAAPILATAHPGGLNAEGCHNDRRNGGYHCHRGGSARAAPSRP